MPSLAEEAANRLDRPIAPVPARLSSRQIDGEDDAIDRLNRQVYEARLEIDAAPDQRELAMRHALIARSLERVGDNAVDIAEQAAFLDDLPRDL